MSTPLVRFPRGELQDLVAELTNVPVVWDNEPLPMVGQTNGQPGWWVQLSIIATKTKGIDEFRTTFDPTKVVNSTEQVSYRVYTVQVTVTSYNEEIYSTDVVDQIRRGLRSLTGKTQTQEAGLAFVEFGPSRDLPTDIDNREVTKSTMDVRLAWQVAIAPGDDDGGWIDSVAEYIDDLTV